MDVLRVEPLRGPVTVRPDLPGSKSITNRALVCAALATGRSRLRGVLDADDTEAMVGVLSDLGAVLGWDRAGCELVVDGWAGRVPPGEGRRLDVRSSGTTARFVLPMLLAGQGRYEIDASMQMRARPMGETFRAVERLGARIEPLGEPGHLPVTVSVDRVPLRSQLDVAGDVSSQFLSGLLLAGPCLGKSLEVSLTTTLVSRPYVEMTIAVMDAFGATVEQGAGGDRFVVPATGYRSADYRIEPDASAASYVFALAAITGSTVRVAGLGRASTQGDVGFVDVLARMGAEVHVGDDEVMVRGTGVLRGVDVDLTELSDTAPTFAVVAAFAEGPSRATGIGFIRRKETDRIAAVVAELRRAGVDAVEDPDGFVVRPPDGGPQAARFATYGDHRMAMAFALVGLRVPGVEIEDPACVGKTFPGYWAMLAAVRGAGQ